MKTNVLYLLALNILPCADWGINSSKRGSVLVRIFMLSLVLSLGLTGFEHGLVWGMVQISDRDQERGEAIQPTTVQSQSPSQLNSYIQQLNSPKFAERQQAMQALLDFGASSLRPLAFEIINGSPESVWRSKQAIETIAIVGDEPTFFQAANILHLLFHNNSKLIGVKIGELEVQWRQEQKRIILRRLQEKGAGVVQAGENQELFARGNIGRPGVILFDRPIMLDQNANAGEIGSNDPIEGRASAQISRSSEELANQIDLILNGSLEDNRTRLFESRQGSVPSTQIAADVARRMELGEELKQREIEMLLEIEMRMQMREIGGMPGLAFTPLQITLDDQWRGSELELAELNKIQDSLMVRLVDLDLPARQLQELAKNPNLNHLEIAGNKLTIDKIDLVFQSPSLARLSFVDRELERLYLMEPSNPDSLKGISFSRCSLRSAAIEQLAHFKQLMSLEFLEMQLDELLFAQMEKMGRLRAVEMQVCKFPKEAYLRLRRFSPQISINFTPQGFLGVRGPLRFGEDFNKVEISQVVPGSAAELGGMLAGDVIKSIDGVPLEKFEDLRLQVAQYKAGDTLNLIIDRNGQEKKLSIELMPFDSSIE